MSRLDCISNRNIRVIFKYVESLLGDSGDLFYGIPFPEDTYRSAKDYLTDEDEWTTYETFQRIFRGANIKQPLNEYDPEILFNEEEEFLAFKLDARIENHELTIHCPVENKKKVVGREVLLEPDIIGGRKVFLGKFSELHSEEENREKKQCIGILITESLKVDNRNILTAGEIYMAPYFILDITYDRLRFRNRLLQPFQRKGKGGETASGMIETKN